MALLGRPPSKGGCLKAHFSQPVSGRGRKYCATYCISMLYSDLVAYVDTYKIALIFFPAPIIFASNMTTFDNQNLQIHIH